MKKLLLFINLFLAAGLFAQETQDYNKVFIDPTSSHAKAQMELIKDLKDTIEKKLQSLGKKHVQLAFLSPDLKDRHLIITEDSPYKMDKGFESDVMKFIVFDFAGETVKNLTIGSKIKRIKYELGYENKLINYNPVNVDSSTIKTEQFDGNKIITFKDLSLDNQITAMRLILSYVNLAFYRIEMMIVTKHEKKEQDSIRQLDI